MEGLIEGLVKTAEGFTIRDRLSVAGDVLTYRSVFRTRSWRTDEIAEFGIDRASWMVRHYEQMQYLQMITTAGELVDFFWTCSSIFLRGSDDDPIYDWLRLAGRFHHCS